MMEHQDQDGAPGIIGAKGPAWRIQEMMEHQDQDGAPGIHR